MLFFLCLAAMKLYLVSFVLRYDMSELGHDTFQRYLDEAGRSLFISLYCHYVTDNIKTKHFSSYRPSLTKTFKSQLTSTLLGYIHRCGNNELNLVHWWQQGVWDECHKLGCQGHQT